MSKAIAYMALGLVTGIALAQPEAPDPNEPAVADSAAEVAAETVPDAPLEDYEASEQISEDLSVSFPIDI